MGFLSSDKGYKPLKQDDSKVDQPYQESQQPAKQKDVSSVDDGMTSKPSEISTWKAVLNIVNYMESAGFLALPYAIHEGGITGVIGLIVIPLILGYSAYILADCLDEEDEVGNRQRVRWTYQDIGMACWTPFRHIIWIIIEITLYIASCSYIVLCGSLMSKAFPRVPISESQWACLGTLLVLPTVFLTHLSHIAWVSLIGVVALVASAGIAMGYELKESAHWDFQSLLFWDSRGVFVSLSIITLSYCIHIFSVSLAAEISNLSRFRVALIWSYLFCTIFKLAFAVAGFLTYTSSTKEVILNNLPSGLPVKIIATFFVLNVLLGYPILFLILVRNIEELALYQQLTERVPPVICFVLLRILMVSAILAFSVAIPHFALIGALAGSLAFCNALTFPGFFHLRLKYNRLSKLQVFYDVVLIILGIIGTILGGISTITSLFRFMK